MLTFICNWITKSMGKILHFLKIYMVSLEQVKGHNDVHAIRIATLVAVKSCCYQIRRVDSRV